MDISVDSSSCYSKGKYLTSPLIALGSGTNLQGGGCLEGGLCIALTLWALGNMRHKCRSLPPCGRHGPKPLEKRYG